MNTNSRNVTYSTVGDYQLPNLTLNQPGSAGQIRQAAPDVPERPSPVLYNTMLLNGSLYPHLMEVEQTAESQMQQTMAQLLKQNPAPDKEQNPDGWVQHANSLSAGRGTGADGADLQLSFSDADYPYRSSTNGNHRPSGERKKPSALFCRRLEIENELRKSWFRDLGDGSSVLWANCIRPSHDRNLRAKRWQGVWRLVGSPIFWTEAGVLLNHDWKGLEFDHYPDHRRSP